jgi:flavodoxin
MKKVLVSYFSASGITADLANRLAQTIGADTFEIRPQKPYSTADLDWTNKMSRSSVEMRDPDCRPPLAKAIPDLTNYQVVFVGFPVWWYREPSIIDTFMEKGNFEGQTVVPFATSGGSGLGDSMQNMQRLAPQAVVKNGQRFSANVSAQELAAWAKQFIN